MPSTFEEADEEPAAPQLTELEMQIKSLARGNGNKQIARSLAIFDKTVRNRVGNIHRELHVLDRQREPSALSEKGCGLLRGLKEA